MSHHRSSPKVLGALFWVGVFFVMVLVAAYWVRNDLLPFFMAFPVLNGVIGVLLLIGILMSVLQMLRLLVESRKMDSMAEALRKLRVDGAHRVQDVVAAAGSGLVGDRCVRTLRVAGNQSSGTAESMALLSDADVESEEGRAIVVRYLLGVLVFLGLMGTFWGVLITVSGVQKVLAALEPERIDDAVAFLTQLKGSMGGMLGGLATSFSTSLFGLGSSVVLGFVDAQARRSRSAVLSDLDKFVVSVLLPVIPPQSEEVVHVAAMSPVPVAQGGELYLSASHQALADNLRRLTEVIALQASTDEKVTESIMEIRGMLEALREQENVARETSQIANRMLQGLLERMDNLGRQMERAVKELRVNRESAEETGKALLDRLRLEGEITNKTVSIGFSDLTRKVELMGRKGDAPTSVKRTETDVKQEI